MNESMMVVLVLSCISISSILAVIAYVIIKRRNKKTGDEATTSSSSSSGTAASSGGLVPATGTGWKTATQTWYESYPKCCKNSPAYDPKASTTECKNFSGCKYQGDFSDGSHMTYDQVKSTRFVSFYDIKQKDQWKGDKNPYWDTNYKHKYILVRKKGGTQALKVKIADTCKDSDCSGCCTKNAQKGGGYLIDIESFTERVFNAGSKPVDMSQIEWKFFTG